MSTSSSSTDTGALRGFHPYQQTRDSGVEWLGLIPAGWEARRLKTLISEPITDGPHETPEFLPDGVPFLSVDGIQEGELIFDDCRRISEKAHLEYSRKCAPRCNDILMGKAASTGKIARVKVDFEFSIWSPLALIRSSEEVLPQYLEYSLKGDVTQAQIDVLCTSNTQKNISMRDIPRLVVALPPLEDQRAIATFLDRETAKIDALVAKKERLIELLQENRTALITQAVTKGLDPNVPMRDSGVEWLGEIPAHWGLRPLKHVADFVNGFAFQPSEWVDDGTPIIRIENLNGGSNFNYTKRDLPGKYRAERGDLLFGWSGNRGTSFGPFIWWRDGVHYVNQHIFKVTCSKSSTRWLYWTLRGVTAYVEKQAHGIIGMVHITRGELGKIVIPSIPIEEQRQIEDFLEQESRHSEAVVETVRRGIDRLKEYRAAIISAAVTGKIDVREEAA